MNINWNAEGYTKDFSFVHEYGEDVLNLISAKKGSRVIDLGCGNGALTEKLNQMGYHAVGVDASDEMLNEARSLHPKLEFQFGNAVSFSLEQPADVIFSNAVLHWIDENNQDDLVKNMNHQLKKGGELVFEFGGKNCAEAVHSTLEKEFEDRGRVYPRTFYFPTISEYAKRLENNGFLVRYAVLFDRPTPQKGEHGLIDWINMFVTKPFEGMDSEQAEQIKKAAEEKLKDTLCQDGVWYIDYTRIRMRAEKISEA